MNGTSTDHGEHPELEELAALIDGRLSEDAAAQVRIHLASCAECREVFFETVDFVREEEARRSLLPFRRRSARVAWKPERSPGRLRRWAIALPTAAALAAGGGYAVYVYDFAPPDLAWLAAAKAVSSDKQIHLWQQTMRGVPEGHDEPISKQSFRLGVAQVNLQVGLEGENFDQADAAAARINELNDDIDPPDHVKAFYRALRATLGKHGRLNALAVGAAEQAQRGYADATLPIYLNFGRWTEAGNLAAAAAKPEFLTRHSTRRFPEYLMSEAGSELDPKVALAVLRIQHVLGHATGSGEPDYGALVPGYATILTFYEPGGGGADLAPPDRPHLRPAQPLPKTLSVLPQLLADLAPSPPRPAAPAPPREAR
jgi:hypothetical protein